MENQEEVPLSRSPVDFFVKPEQISGIFFDSDTINFPGCFHTGILRNFIFIFRYQVCLFRHSGFCKCICKPEKFQQKEDPCDPYSRFSYLFSSVSMSPRMIRAVEIADGIHSFQNPDRIPVPAAVIKSFSVCFSILSRHIPIISFFRYFLNKKTYDLRVFSIQHKIERLFSLL